MDGKYRPLPGFNKCENLLDSGPQDWKHYITSLITFNTILFVFGYLVLVFQPFTPLNPEGKTLLSPATIFNSVVSFMTNTDLQHYSGEQHLTNFSQIFFWNRQPLHLGGHRLKRSCRCNTRTEGGHPHWKLLR
ncbi:potassium-transporting ATPase subunit KdpA [Candidatus Magnetominusculus dajiuhuensis]|uniref:potassium-transporting ATPase subunit KdpA n=1 Tax=Candidatus Magnetominusculus dajiuhuensis TaxID=3137712 RepID=UPI003B43B38A